MAKVTTVQVPTFNLQLSSEEAARVLAVLKLVRDDVIESVVDEMKLGDVPETVTATSKSDTLEVKDA